MRAGRAGRAGRADQEGQADRADQEVQADLPVTGVQVVALVREWDPEDHLGVIWPASDGGLLTVVALAGREDRDLGIDLQVDLRTISTITRPIPTLLQSALPQFQAHLLHLLPPHPPPTMPSPGMMIEVFSY